MCPQPRNSSVRLTNHIASKVMKGKNRLMMIPLVRAEDVKESNNSLVEVKTPLEKPASTLRTFGRVYRISLVGN